jgi:hypothetical protein
MTLKPQDTVIHVKFATSSYLECKVENVYVYSESQSTGKVNPLVGAKLITTDTELINCYCYSLVPEDVERRKKLYSENCELKAKYQKKDELYYIPDIKDIYAVKPTLCDYLVKTKLKDHLPDSICDSSGNHDLILTSQGCVLRSHLKNGQDQVKQLSIKELLT